jgi:hypothetical protein
VSLSEEDKRWISDELERVESNIAAEFQTWPMESGCDNQGSGDALPPDNNPNSPIDI